MIVRKYQDSDYANVYELVKCTMPRNLPDRLGGCGVVIEEGNKIAAFCWALTSSDSDVACVEFFTVGQEFRDKKIYGPIVITRLLQELKAIGCKEVIGLMVNGEKYTETLVRIYHEVGMAANQGYVVNGCIDTILSGIENRYGSGVKK